MTKDTNQGAERIDEAQLESVNGGGAGSGKVSMNDVKGDPSQWGLQVYKKGSFDITE